MTSLLDYLNADRHYHTFTHPGDMFRTLDEVFPEAKHYKPLKYAVIYHDCTYEMGAKDNEYRSAKVMAEELARIWVNSEDIRESERLVMLTVRHQTDRTNDIIGSILIDLDLAGLGADRKHYINNSKLIRREFSAISDEAWRAGRIKFLEDFLSREYIYHTDRAFDLWEDAARSNLVAELDYLQGENYGV